MGAGWTFVRAPKGDIDDEGQMVAAGPKANGRLTAFAKRHGFYPVDEAGYIALPILEQVENQDEEALQAKIRELSWEVPASSWQAIDCQGAPKASPRRFIDGTLSSRTIGAIWVDGVRRPLVLAAVGALELWLDGGKLVRPPDGFALKTVLCVVSNGLASDEVAELAAGCSQLSIQLLAAESPDLSVDFDVLRRRSFDLAKQAMEGQERDLLLREPTMPALVDGLLERRLISIESQGMPVVGMVKRQLRQYLPNSHVALLYELKPGQRTPAFVLETEHARLVSWYLRLSTTDNAGPNYGLVRLTAPLEYLSTAFPDSSERNTEISGVSAFVRSIRHRQASYARVGVSLEPIVRVEDELRAVMPSIAEISARMYRSLGG